MQSARCSRSKDLDLGESEKRQRNATWATSQGQGGTASDGGAKPFETIEERGKTKCKGTPLSSLQGVAVHGMVGMTNTFKHSNEGVKDTRFANCLQVLSGVNPRIDARREMFAKPRISHDLSE